jgi:hypothetical protein
LRRVLRPYGRFSERIRVGLIYQALGERDQAFEWYAKGSDKRGEFLLWLTIDPFFDEVRSDPRLTDLVRGVGLATPAR